MRNIKKIIAIFCTMVMAVSCMAFVTCAESTEAVMTTVLPQKSLLNVALAKPVYSSSMLDEGTTSHTYAVDWSAYDQLAVKKDSNLRPASYWAPKAEDTAPWIMVDLTKEYMFKRLEFQIEPKKNFVISASRDKENWTVIHEQGDTEYTLTNKYFFRLDLEKADSFRYLKITRPEGYNGSDFKVYDIAVYAPYHTNQRNIAKGLGRAAISGGIEADNDPENLYGAYHEKTLADGNYDNWGYSYSHVEADDTTKDYFTIDLGKAYKINYIELTNRNSATPSDKTQAVVTSKPGETNAGAINNFEIWGANVGGNAETLQADSSAEKGGSYQGRNAAGEEIDFGPQMSTVRFDMDFSEPKRYIQIAADNNIQKLSLAEIGIYTDSENVVTEALLEEVATGKNSYGANGDQRAANGYAHDRGNPNTTWKSFTDPNGDGDTSDAYMVYSIDLESVYNVRKIEVKVVKDSCCGDIARKNFEIWGGSEKKGIGYDGDYDAQMLACQGSVAATSNTITFDVDVFNRTRYITIAAKENHQIFGEIYVYAEADGQYLDVSTGKTASLKAMTNGSKGIEASNYCEGITDSTGALIGNQGASQTLGVAYTPGNNASLGFKGNKFRMPSHWIDLGKSMQVDFLRLYARTDDYISHRNVGLTVWGSNNLTSDWVQLTTTQTNKAVTGRYSDVAINSLEEYRYIGIAKNNNDISRGIWYYSTSTTPSYRVNYTTHELDFPEVVVYAKDRPEPLKNIAPLAQVIEPTNDEDVAKIFDGDESTAYTGEYALIDLGEAYVIDSYEAVGGGDNLALYGYVENAEDIVVIEEGATVRYVAVSGAVELSELRLFTEWSNCDKIVVATCKFQDSIEKGGNKIVVLDANTFGVDLNLCNLTSETVYFDTFLVLYDNDKKIAEINMVSDVVAAYSGKNVVYGFDSPEEEIPAGYELKCFTWQKDLTQLHNYFSIIQP